MALANLAPNDVFFETILHQGLQDLTIEEVLLVEKEPAVNKGENYVGQLTRFTLKFKCNVPKETSTERIDKLAYLILKEEPIAGPETLEIFRKSNIFGTEQAMLEDVVPRIEELIQRRFGPKVYYTSIEPPIIVMEDLAAFGFKNKNRKLGLNEEQCLLILQNLADFHAASVFLYEQDPQFVSRFTKGLLNDATLDIFFNFLSSAVRNIAKLVSNWPDKQYVSIADKLGQRSKDMTQKFEEVYQCDEDELKVLNHGDLWVNNIMFRDDENGHPEDVRFIDYQVSIWTSPAIDLLYFLNINPERKLRGTHDDIFLEKYLARLSSTMRKLGCCKNPPTMEQLKKSMHKRRVFALLAAFALGPKVSAEDEYIEDIDQLLRNAGESKVDPLKSPDAQKMMEKMLPILHERGYLD